MKGFPHNALASAAYMAGYSKGLSCHALVLEKPFFSASGSRLATWPKWKEHHTDGVVGLFLFAWER
jgi:hypothetical protein